MLNNAATNFFSKINAVFNKVGDASHLISDVNLATVGTTGDVKDASHWLQREKFLNFVDVEVAVPVGLSCNYMELINTLEQLWMNYLTHIKTGLLDPVKSNLAIVANDPARATTKLTIRELNTAYLLYKTSPEVVRKQITEMFNGPKLDTVKLGKVFSSSREYEAVLLRAIELRAQITEKGLKVLKEDIETIRQATDTILEYPTSENMTGHGIDAKLADHLSNELMNASKWVELHGVYLLTLDESINSLHQIQEKINKLIKKK